MPVVTADMTRNAESANVGDGQDAMAAVMNRLFKLQKQRARQMGAVQEAYNKRVAQLRKDALARHKEIQRQMLRSRAYKTLELVKSIERRKELEKQMKEVVLRMHLEVRIVEDTMLAGYDGRAAEAQQAATGAAKGHVQGPLAGRDI